MMVRFLHPPPTFKGNLMSIRKNERRDRAIERAREYYAMVNAGKHWYIGKDPEAIARFRNRYSTEAVYVEQFLPKAKRKFVEPAEVTEEEVYVR